MAARKSKRGPEADRIDFISALDEIEKEKHIKKEVMLAALEDSLKLACKSQFGKNVNPRVSIHPDTGEVKVLEDFEVVSDEDAAKEEEEDGDASSRAPGGSSTISLTEARLKFDEKAEVGDVVSREVTPRNFGRIAATKAKQTIVQTIRQEERRVVYEYFKEKQHDIITGVVQRIDRKNGVVKNIMINLEDRLDTVLTENEMVKGEVFAPTDRIKLYVVDVHETQKDPKVVVSRSHPDFVKCLFEEEVTEIQDGIVEIMSIAREAGSRTKMAVYTSNPNVDPVGACVGVNGSRVNAVVNELHGEKIDIIVWSDLPDILIENALSPASVISVEVDIDEKTAEVIVPDNQLSLAIGKEGQNARLAAKLTGYKIDIKCESDQFDF